MSYIHHFIHLYFFTEFEILFYIYYILPYEKKLVYNMFDVSKIIGKFDDDIVITLINNISNSNSKGGSNKYNGQCDAEQDRIDNSNNKLWTYCFIYIIFINSILCLLFVYDLILNYKLYNENKDCKAINQNNQNNDKKYNSQSALTAFGSGNKLDLNYKKTDNISNFEIDMIDLEIDLTEASVNNSPTNILEKIKCRSKSISYNSYYIYYWNKSVLVIAMCNTLKFILFIGVFEYLFFVFIINKFKIVNSELLLCKLLKEF